MVGSTKNCPVARVSVAVIAVLTLAIGVVASKPNPVAANPDPPQLIVNRPNGVTGWNFAPGGTADIHVFDHLNDPNPPLKDEQEGIDGDGQFSHYFQNFTIQPGMWVVVTDGTDTKDVVATDMEVWGSNATLGTVYGHATPGSDVTVKTLEGQGCWRTVTADGNGEWTVDFGQDDPNSQPPDCTATPFDVPLISPGQQLGTNGDAFQKDGDGDWSAHEGWSPSRINVSAMANMIETIGTSFQRGVDVTVTIDDPSTTGPNQVPDVTATATANWGWPSQFDLCTFPGAQVNQNGCTAVGGPIDIQPGFTVTASDGRTTKTEIVTALQVTTASRSQSKVFGTTTPNTDVLVTVYNQQSERRVTADNNGDWTADFSVAQGNNPPVQFSNNTSGSAFQLELNGQIDGDETNSFFSAQSYLNEFPNMGLADGQFVGLTGGNWEPNKNMTVVECTRFSGGPNPNVCDNANAAQQYVTNGNGTVQGQFQVRRVINTSSGPYNCATEPNGCGLSAILWDGDVGSSQVLAIYGPDNNPIGFASAYLDINPNSNLHDGQMVNISGAGWPANKTMHVSECGRNLGGPSPQTCDPNTTQDFQTNDFGNVSGSYQVSRTVHITVGGQEGDYDCMFLQNGCGLVSVVWHGEENNVGQGITLSGPDNQPISVGAFLHVDPSDDLHEGQMVTITGAGWPASRPMDVAECAIGYPLGYNSCDASTQQHFTTNPDGTVFGSFRVSRSIFTADTGVLDCAAATNSCGLDAVAWHGAVGDLGAGFTLAFPENNPLNFAPPVDPLAPTITIKSPVDGALIPEHKLVKAGYSCADTGGSGLAGCGGPVANGSPIDTSVLGVHTFMVTARDRDGNLTVLTRHYTVTDATAPMIVLTTPSPGATYNKGAFVAASYNCFDVDSGIRSCGGTVPNGWGIDTSTIGKKTFMVTAIDNAGNVTKVTATYNVVYGWNGWAYRDPPPALNPGGNAGQRLDVGFYLSGNQGLPITSSVKSVAIDCTYGFPVGRSEAATGTLVYSVDSYHFVWTTKAAWAGTCRQLQITLKDGTAHNVNFQFN